MKFEDQIEYIQKQLQKEYGLSIDNWASLRELLDSSYTLSENVWLLRSQLIDLVNEHIQEFADRLTPKSLGRLTMDLSESKRDWLEIAEEED